VATRPPVSLPKLSRRSRILLIIASVVVLALLLGARFLETYVDWLWFGEVGARRVFSTIVLTRIVLFFAVGLLIGGALAVSLMIAYRTRPVFVPISGSDDPLARYRSAIVGRIKLFGIGIPLLTGLIAGDVQVMFMTPPSSLPFIGGEKVRALAYTGAKRFARLPDVPTLAEAGVPGMEGLASWTGMLAPAKTPDAVLARLHEEVQKAVATATVRERLTGIGVIPLGSAPAEFKPFIAVQVKQIADIVRAAGIEPQ